MEEQQILEKPKRKIDFKLLGIILLVVVVFSFYYFQDKLQRIEPKQIKESNELINELQILATRSHDYEQCLLKANEILAKDQSNKDAWQWKGACEFGLRKFSDSKTSFEKLLTLDPQNAGAKNYLEILNDPRSNLTSLIDVSEQDFGAKLDFIPDSSILAFVQAYEIPAKENQLPIIFSRYNSLKNFNETVSYFEAQFKKAELKFNLAQQKNGNVYDVISKKAAIEYNIFVVKGSPVNIQIIIFEKK